MPQYPQYGRVIRQQPNNERENIIADAMIRAIGGLLQYSDTMDQRTKAEQKWKAGHALEQQRVAQGQQTIDLQRQQAESMAGDRARRSIREAGGDQALAASYVGNPMLGTMGEQPTLPPVMARSPTFQGRTVGGAPEVTMQAQGMGPSPIQRYAESVAQERARQQWASTMGGLTKGVEESGADIYQGKTTLALGLADLDSQYSTYKDMPFVDKAKLDEWYAKSREALEMSTPPPGQEKKELTFDELKQLERIKNPFQYREPAKADERELADLLGRWESGKMDPKDFLTAGNKLGRKGNTAFTNYKTPEEAEAGLRRALELRSAKRDDLNEVKGTTRVERDANKIVKLIASADRDLVRNTSELAKARKGGDQRQIQQLEQGRAAILARRWQGTMSLKEAEPNHPMNKPNEKMLVEKLEELSSVPPGDEFDSAASRIGLSRDDAVALLRMYNIQPKPQESQERNYLQEQTQRFSDEQINLYRRSIQRNPDFVRVLQGKLDRGEYSPVQASQISTLLYEAGGGPVRKSVKRTGIWGIER